MNWHDVRVAAFATLALLGAGSSYPAGAALEMSKVIVDIAADAPPRDDIEIFNSGDERLYVAVQPAEMIEPGMPGERRVESVDPAVTGLLTTPQKLVLEPGQRRLVRVAMVAPRGTRERVYRLMIKPVAGDVTAARTSLKVFVGYDALILVRPTTITGALTAVRTGRQVTFHNGTNSSVELAEGTQCGPDAAACVKLPSKRLYAGADWTIPLERAAPVRYEVLGVRNATRIIETN